MWNGDIEISLCRPSERMEGFFRNGEGDECIFVHEGSGTLETIFGDLPYKQGDYLVVPRGTTYRFVPESDEQRYLVFETPGLIEIPKRYRNQYGQLLEGAPYYHRDIHPPGELNTHRDRGDYEVKVRVRDGYQTYGLDYHPFDVVGWDGYLYPWTFSIARLRADHRPDPPAAALAPDVPGPELRDLLVLPAQARLRPAGGPIPYHHSNLQSEEMIYYVSGKFGSRHGDRGRLDHAASLGPAARPAPRPAEKSIGVTRRTSSQ